MQNNIKLLVVVLSVLICGCAGATTVPEYYNLEWLVTQEKYVYSPAEDVYADSGSRLPFVKREELLSDEQRTFYDSRGASDSRSLGGIRGPGSVRLHGSPSLNVGKRDLVDLTTYMVNYTITAILLHTINAYLPYKRQPLLPLS